LKEYIKAIEVCSLFIDEMVKIKGIRNFDKNKFNSVIKNMESIEFSINYRNSLLAFLQDS